MTKMMDWIRYGCVGMGLLIVCGCAASGEPWTQWGGPYRNFTTTASRLPRSWPASGPTTLWKRELGDGYSSIISDGKTLYTMFRKGTVPSADDDDAAEEGPKAPPEYEQETVIAIDAATGRTKWSYAYDAPFIEIDEDHRQPTQFGFGPNSTPLLVGGRLFAIGHTSIMHCLDAETGRVLWRKDLYHDTEGSFLRFGYAVSPVAYKNTVIVLVGGEGQGVVALDQASGDVVWKSTDLPCSYASPVIVNVEGEDHLIAYLEGAIVGLSPTDGRVHWSLEAKSRFHTSISTPIWCPDDILYFVVRGGDGARAVHLAHHGDHIQPEPVWNNHKIKGSLSDPVVVGGLLCGAAGGSVGMMQAFDFRTGKIAWKKRGLAKVKPVRTPGKLVLLDGKGRLMLATATGEGITVHAEAQLLEEPAWTAPTVVGDKVYLRDKKSIMAVRLR